MKNLLLFCFIFTFIRIGEAQVNDIRVQEVNEPPKVQEEENSAKEQLYMVVEVMPKYGEGGTADLLKFISANIKYPDSAIDNEYEGTVYLSFVVNKSGALENIHAIREVSGAPELTKEAIRVVKLTDGKWQPGMQNGKLVSVQYNLPIKFKLQ